MNDEGIMREISKFGKVKSTVVREGDKYVVAVMKGYTHGTGDGGIGVMGSRSVLDINFKTRSGAERLHQKIKKSKFWG